MSAVQTTDRPSQTFLESVDKDQPNKATETGIRPADSRDAIENGAKDIGANPKDTEAKQKADAKLQDAIRALSEARDSGDENTIKEANKVLETAKAEQEASTAKVAASNIVQPSETEEGEEASPFTPWVARPSFTGGEDGFQDYGPKFEFRKEPWLKVGDRDLGDFANALDHLSDSGRIVKAQTNSWTRFVTGALIWPAALFFLFSGPSRSQREVDAARTESAEIMNALGAKTPDVSGNFGELYAAELAKLDADRKYSAWDLTNNIRLDLQEQIAKIREASTELSSQASLVEAGTALTKAEAKQRLLDMFIAGASGEKTVKEHTDELNAVKFADQAEWTGDTEREAKVNTLGLYLYQIGGEDLEGSLYRLEERSWIDGVMSKVTGWFGKNEAVQKLQEQAENIGEKAAVIAGETINNAKEVYTKSITEGLSKAAGELVNPLGEAVETGADALKGAGIFQEGLIAKGVGFFKGLLSKATDPELIKTAAKGFTDAQLGGFSEAFTGESEAEQPRVKPAEAA